MMRTFGASIGLVCMGLVGFAGLAGSAAAMQEAVGSAPPEGAEAKAGAEQGEKSGSTTQPVSQSADEPKPRREPSPSEIIKMLQEERGARKTVLTLPSRPGEERRTRIVEAPNAIAPVARKLLPDGSRIVDRPGRLARQDDYFVFSFEGRGEGAPEPPIRLLPNRLLEDMEVYSEGGQKPAVFVVSGEVTEYRGVNYLLIQKLLVQPDLGNLK